MRAALILSLILPGMALGQEFTTLKGHGGPIMGVAVSEAGRVATASFDNSVGLWKGREPRWLEGHEAAVTVIAFGPDGRLVSGGDDFAVRQWGDDPRELGRHAGKVTALAFAPDGSVVSGSWDGSIMVWPEGRALAAPGSGVNDLGFDAQGRLWAATVGGLLLRYDTLDADPLPIANQGFGINELELGEDWVAYGAVDGATRVVDFDGAPVKDFTLDRRPILSMDYHAATDQIAVGDGQGFIMVIDTADWQITRDFRATRQGPVWALAYSPDGSVIHAGGLDDVAYAWPVAMLDQFDAAIDGSRSFLRAPEEMSNGERQFMRKCSICHSLEDGPSRKAGPTLHGVFGRAAGTLPGYTYSDTLDGSAIVWDETTIDALFDEGPDHYIPGSKMPMQVISGADDRADLIAFLKQATQEDTDQQ